MKKKRNLIVENWFRFLNTYIEVDLPFLINTGISNIGMENGPRSSRMRDRWGIVTVVEWNYANSWTTNNIDVTVRGCTICTHSGLTKRVSRVIRTNCHAFSHRTCIDGRTGFMSESRHGFRFVSNLGYSLPRVRLWTQRKFCLFVDEIKCFIYLFIYFLRRIIV